MEDEDSYTYEYEYESDDGSELEVEIVDKIMDEVFNEDKMCDYPSDKITREIYEKINNNTIKVEELGTLIKSPFSEMKIVHPMKTTHELQKTGMDKLFSIFREATRTNGERDTIRNRFMFLSNLISPGFTNNAGLYIVLNKPTMLFTLPSSSVNSSTVTSPIAHIASMIKPSLNLFTTTIYITKNTWNYLPEPRPELKNDYSHAVSLCIDSTRKLVYLIDSNGVYDKPIHTLVIAILNKELKPWLPGYTIESEVLPIPYINTTIESKICNRTAGMCATWARFIPLMIILNTHFTSRTGHIELLSRFDNNFRNMFLDKAFRDITLIELPRLFDVYEYLFLGGFKPGKYSSVLGKLTQAGCKSKTEFELMGMNIYPLSERIEFYVDWIKENTYSLLKLVNSDDIRNDIQNIDEIFNEYKEYKNKLRNCVSINQLFERYDPGENIDLRKKRTINLSYTLGNFSTKRKFGESLDGEDVKVGGSIRHHFTFDGMNIDDYIKTSLPYDEITIEYKTKSMLDITLKERSYVNVEVPIILACLNFGTAYHIDTQSYGKVIFSYAKEDSK
jgi:hypothetical protein